MSDNDQPLAATTQMKPHRIFFFFTGLTTGIILTLATGLFWNVHRAMHHYVSIQIGKMLEIETLQLKNGDRLTGRVLFQNEKEVVFEFEKGSAKFTRAEITKIEKNPYARYIQGLW